VRICLVSPHLPPDQAANALLPAQLGTWAAAAGHDVCFVAEAPAQGGSSARLPGPVRRVPRRAAGSGLTRALRIDTWKRTRAIRAALDDVAAGADLLHLHSNGLIVEMASRWASRRGRPSVLTMYGTEIWHYRRRRPIDLFTQAYMRAGAVTFYSRRLLDRARALGLSRANLTVIYPAVGEAFTTPDSDTRAAWRRELEIGEPFVILNVKRLHELAGQHFLIEAFARVARERDDVRLVICGTGPLRQALEQRAAALGISRLVTFAGLVPNDRIARYAAVADVFALPSLLEALPTVAVEALAAGTPVVTADHPGGLELAEIFGDDVVVVRRENVEELAEQLTASIERPRRVRQETPALVEQHFSARAIQSAYLDLYASTVRAGHG
jgi:glycosyltransferase involved in cell wall biosynthesis